MCAKPNQEDLATAYHEMGHIAYYMAYKENPFPYREGANPGFHEAIGDLMSLAFNTPSHLKKLGLLEAEDNSRNDFVLLEDGTRYSKSDINKLMALALSHVAFWPYALALESWRWNLFSGKTKKSKLVEKCVSNNL